MRQPLCLHVRAKQAREIHVAVDRMVEPSTHSRTVLIVTGGARSNVHEVELVD